MLKKALAAAAVVFLVLTALCPIVLAAPIYDAKGYLEESLISALSKAMTAFSDSTNSNDVSLSMPKLESAPVLPDQQEQQKPETSDAPALDAEQSEPEPETTPDVTPKPTATPVVAPKPTASPVVTPKPTAAPVVTPKPTNTPKPTASPAVTPKPVQTPVPANVPPTIDTSTVSDGYVRVAFTSNVKLMVQTVFGNTVQNFNMANDGSFTNIPLNLGEGSYKIRLLRNIEGSRYAVEKSATVTYQSDTTNNVYLLSIPTIQFDSSMTAIKKAAALTSNKTTAYDKLSAIYDYVVKNISYDYDKLDNLPNGYVPDIEATYASKKGICYDFASLFAAMCRSQGIPCKLVKGYTVKTAGFHAWNEVYINGEWKIIDTTADSVYRAKGLSYSMFKSQSYVTSITQSY